MSFEFYRLKNGVRVVLVPMLGVESTSVGVYIATGSRYETRKNNGVSHFLEHMVFKGTKKYPTMRETSYLEGLGAIQNAWTDVDATCYWTKIPADHWTRGLDLMADLALAPTIPEADLEIERGVILEEINRRDDRPDEIVSEALLERMFAPNALGLPTLGPAEVIASLKREDFVGYHKAQYVSGRIVVALAGKINVSEAKKQVEELFGQLPPADGLASEEYRDTQGAPHTIIRSKKLAAQAHLELGFRGVTDSDPRRYALSLLTTYLGRGLSSRLFMELREKRGLCYAVRADEARWTDCGLWSVYAGVALDKLEQAIEGILGEIKRVKDHKLTADEVAAAKEKVRGPLVFSMENPMHQMEFYARQALDRPEEILTFNEVIDRLMQIDEVMIQNVAQELFASGKLTLAVVGPVAASRGEKLVQRLVV